MLKIIQKFKLYSIFNKRINLQIILTFLKLKFNNLQEFVKKLHMFVYIVRLFFKHIPALVIKIFIK